MPDRPAGSGLHMEHSRQMWPIDHAVVMLKQMGFPSDRLGHLTEYPQCGNAEEEGVVTKLFGQPIVANPKWYGAANRARKIRMSPATTDNIKRYHPNIDPAKPIGDWKWVGNGSGCAETFPVVTLRSHMIVLVEQLMFELRPLAEWEQTAVDRIKMQHVSTGEVRFISRAFWLLWLGFEGTPLPKIVDEIWPCFEHILAATGEQLAATSQDASACGAHRWCRNCEILFQHLGQAWHVQSLTDCAVGWLSRVLDYHVQGDRSVAWFDRPDEPAHQCGPFCPHNPKQGR